jgi:hypothetical protein
MLWLDRNLKWNGSPADDSSAEIDTGVGVLKILFFLQGNIFLLNIFESFSTLPVLQFTHNIYMYCLLSNIILIVISMYTLYAAVVS